MTLKNLFGSSFIYLFYDFCDGKENVIVAHDFLDRICNQQINPVPVVQQVLLFTPAFPYSALQQIALYCTLEQLLRNGNKNSAALIAGVPPESEPESRYFSMPSSGKKQRYSCFPAETLLFGKSAVPLNLLHLVSS